MPAATLRERLRHILDAIELIQTHTRGKSLDDYAADPVLQAAVERWLLIVAEAARFVPDDVRQKHPEIPWRSVADFGNVLRHAYDQVAPHRVLLVVVDHIPPLAAAVRTIMGEAEV